MPRAALDQLEATALRTQVSGELDSGQTTRAAVFCNVV
jgi:hypothetical protein